MELYEELVARGLIAQVTDEKLIKELINNGNIFAEITLPFEEEDKSLVSTFKEMIKFEESKYEL